MTAAAWGAPVLDITVLAVAFGCAVATWIVSRPKSGAELSSFDAPNPVDDSR